MNPLARLAVFAVAAVASLGVGASVGAAIGPSTDPSPEPVHPAHDEPAPPPPEAVPSTATVPPTTHAHAPGTNP